MNAYKFSSGPNVQATPPETEITKVLEKAFTDDPLTRDEKDFIADTLYGTFGSGTTYRLMGWGWPMQNAKQMQRILVSFKGTPDAFRVFYAADKTSIRQALTSCSQPIAEMFIVAKELS